MASYHGVTALVRIGTSDSTDERNIKFAALPRIGETVNMPSGPYTVADVGWSVTEVGKTAATSFMGQPIIVLRPLS